MGRRTLLTGIVSGAVIGGIISLFNADARSYAKETLCETRTKAAHCMKNPTETVNTIRQTIIDLNETLASGTEGTLNALEQVENTLEKVTKRM